MKAVLLFTEHLILKIPAVFKTLYAFPKRINHVSIISVFTRQYSIACFCTLQSLAKVSFTEAKVLTLMFRHVKALVSSYEKQEDVYVPE